MKIAALGLMMALTASAQELPRYVAKKPVSGTIRVWGHGAEGKDYITGLVVKWENGFQRLHPDVKFVNELHGTASAMGALYTGKGDVAVMGRLIWPAEVEAFTDVLGRKPVGIDVCTGSVDIRNKDFALTMVVHEGNPLKHLSLAQIHDVFGVTAHPVKTWGDLGLTGAWANRPVHLYGFEISRGFGYYLQQKAFGGASIWNPGLVELGDQKKPEGGLYDAGQRVVDAVAKDTDGIGFSSALYKADGVRVVPLGPVGGPFVLPTKKTVADRTYPLNEVITAFFDRKPGDSESEAVAEFLRYVLSADGQQAVTEDGGYTALTGKISAEQLRKLQR